MVDNQSDSGVAMLLRSGEVEVIICDAKVFREWRSNSPQADLSKIHQPVIVISNGASVSEAVELMKTGIHHYLSTPVDVDDLLEAVATASEVALSDRTLQEELCSAGIADLPMVFRSLAMKRLMKLVRSIAASEASVVIQGPSGSGKELLARSIHLMSERADGPFVPVDSSAIPESLLESELFGYRRGAFTGAQTDKPGILEASDRGTLFLDEVGNLSVPVQAKLLRFLQERCFRRVGDVRERSVDTRVVSATNVDLKQAVSDGVFREDLFYRLSVFVLEIPPLCQRTDDIPALADYFIHRQHIRTGFPVFGIAPDALAALVEYSWPGNVRQLENAIERAVILRRAGRICVADLPREVSASATAPRQARSLATIEKQHILELLDQHGGNQSEVARILGVSRRTIYRRLKTWGLHSDGG
jgi:DNA-binding NtrC family response regulator